VYAIDIQVHNPQFIF